MGQIHFDVISKTAVAPFLWYCITPCVYCHILVLVDGNHTVQELHQEPTPCLLPHKTSANQTSDKLEQQLLTEQMNLDNQSSLHTLHWKTSFTLSGSDDH
jgi:hypothetical protein